MTDPKAESVVEHVVVLMLENRSFDHMLGLLDSDPAKYDGVAVNDERFFNLSDPTNPKSSRVYVSADATFDLSVDPPHSHASVLEQIGLGPWGTPRMDGFVAAYKRALAGKAGRKVIHWPQVIMAAIMVISTLALTVANGWPLLPVLVPALLLIIGGVVNLLQRRTRVLVNMPWRRWFLLFAAGVLVLSGFSLLLGRWLGYWERFGVLVLLLGISGILAHRLFMRTQAPPPMRPDQEREIMRCMRPMEQLPALATLAQSFALCTRWHCSVPGATWPNRLFAHSGTSDNTVDIEVGLYENGTIFDRLNEASQRWHIYHHERSLAQVGVFSRLTDIGNRPNWYLMPDFAKHVEQGKLPAYSFIEPCHTGPASNSQHPDNNDYDRPPDKDGLTDFQRGECLIASIYETLRKNPAVFSKTIFIITYDEHGGFYDHVPPPTNAIPPTPIHGAKRKSDVPRFVGWFLEQPTSAFEFSVLGPRVPTVVISPLVRKQVDRTIYDHSSIPATVRQLFAPRTGPLSEREKNAPTLSHLWSNDLIRSDLPDLSGICKGKTMTAPTVAAAQPARPRDDEFARQMIQLAAQLGPKLTQRPAPLFQTVRLKGEAGSRAAEPHAGPSAHPDQFSPEAVAAALADRASEARGE